MKRTVYVPVYIKTEEDLPKKEGTYIVSLIIDNEEEVQLWRKPKNKVQKDIWLRYSKYYLKPIELPDEGEALTIANKDGKREDGFGIDHIDEDYAEGFIGGYNWIIKLLKS